MPEKRLAALTSPTHYRWGRTALSRNLGSSYPHHTYLDLCRTKPRFSRPEGTTTYTEPDILTCGCSTKDPLHSPTAL